MEVNRYTTTALSKFNPLSLQEIMMVPQLKRNIHDKAIEETSTYDPLFGSVKTHVGMRAAADAVINEYRDEVIKLQKDLNENGVGFNTKGIVSGLSKRVASEIGPSGRLGQLSAWNDNYNELLKKNQEIAKSSKQNAQVADAHFAAAVNNYFKDANGQFFNSDGRTVKAFNFNNWAPEYVNEVETFAKVFEGLGMTSTEIQNAWDNIDMDAYGGLFIKNSAGTHRVLNESNISAINERLKVFNSLRNDPMSKLRQSMSYSGETPLTKEEIEAYMKSYIKTTDKDIRTVSNSVSAKPKHLLEGSGTNTDPEGIPISTSSEDVLDTKTRTELDNLKYNIGRDLAHDQKTLSGVLLPSLYLPKDAWGLLATGYSLKDKNSKYDRHDGYSTYAKQLGISEKDMNSKESAKKVLDYISNMSNTKTNVVYVQPSKDGEFDKTTADKRGDLIGRKLTMDSSANVLYDGEWTTNFNKVVADNKGIKNVTYLGERKAGTGGSNVKSWGAEKAEVTFNNDTKKVIEVAKNDQELHADPLNRVKNAINMGVITTMTRPNTDIEIGRGFDNSLITSSYNPNNDTYTLKVEGNVVTSDSVSEFKKDDASKIISQITK